MISYHLAPPSSGGFAFSQGFRMAQTDEVMRVARCASKYVWSPIIWRGGRRRQVNFEGADWLVLDFDDGEMSLKGAVKAFCDYRGFIGTTKSHQKDKGGLICDRFRVAILFERTITDLRVYRWNMSQIQKHYPCDKSCKDGARFFYPCKEIVAVWDGPDYGVHEVSTLIPPSFDLPVMYTSYKNNGLLPPWAESHLKREIPQGERNTTIYRISKDLSKAGLTEEEILARVKSSRTYENVVMTSLLEVEIRSAVMSGIKKANEERGVKDE